MTNIISEFDGPVVFNNKLTSTSTKGIEAGSLFLQGDATVSRKQTIGISYSFSLLVTLVISHTLLILLRVVTVVGFIPQIMTGIALVM